MTSFFANQLDYIFFLYGFSFITMAAVCFPLSRKPDSGLPWEYLGFFGLIHGINEWLDMTALVFGDPLLFAELRFVFMTTSFIFLFEFARRGIRKLGLRATGPWISAVLICFIVVTRLLLSLPEANAIARYLLCLTGACGSSLVLLHYRARLGSKSRWLALTAFSMLMYGVFAGLIVSKVGFFPGNKLNAQLITSALSGMPVQVFRAGCAFLMSLGIWQYYIHIPPNNVHPLPQKDRMLAGLGWSLIAVLIAGWVGTEAGRNYGKTIDQGAMHSRYESAQEVARNSIRLMETTARTVAENEELSRFVRAPSPMGLDRVNAILDRFKVFIPGSILFVLDSKGQVLASTNRYTPQSFVGDNYGIRPYFQIAMEGRLGHFWARGLKTGQMSYYVGAPVRDASGKVIGVLTYRSALSDFNVFKLIEDPAWVTDDHGMIILTNRPKLLYQTVKPLTPEEVRLILLANPAVEIGESLFERLHRSGDLVRFEGQEFRYWTHQGSVANWEFTFLSPAQSYTPFRFSGIVITLLIALLITGIFVYRQQEIDNQLELVESEARYRQLYEDGGAVMLIIDPVTGMIQDANRLALKFYRRSIDELRSWSVFDLTISEPEKLRSWIKKLELQTRDRSEFRQRISAQEVREVEVYSMWLLLRGKEVIFAIVYDLTERKNAEQEAAKFQAQLFHSEKLASVGTLAAGVGHEINNPLTIIRGLIEILKGKLGEHMSEEIAKLLRKQELAVERIVKIVNGLRLFARSDTPHLESVNLHYAIDETLSLIDQIYSKAGVQLVLKLDSANPVFLGNHGKVQQVIMNIVSNAKDALETVEGNRIIEISSKDRDDTIMLEIRDNGTGIPSDKLDKVFDPFFTTKPPGKGTGLGLPICRTIVESFGGRISLRSSANLGTTVSIELPRTRAFLDPDPDRRNQAPEALKLSGRVIVIDDETDIRDLLRGHLQRFGLEVVEAPNGNEAAELMSQSAFDYAIIDIHMPGMSGEVLIEKVRQFPTCVKTKLIATSAGIVTQFSGPQRDTLRRSIHGYLQKPFDVETLSKLFKSLSS